MPRRPILVLAAIILLIAGMLASIFKLNAHADQTYHYKSFSLKNFFAILPAYLLGFAGLLFQENASTLNAIVMYAAGIAYLLYLIGQLAKKTNPGIALYSVFVMAVAWAPLLLLFLLRQDAKNKRGHR